MARQKAKKLAARSRTRRRAGDAAAREPGAGASSGPENRPGARAPGRRGRTMLWKDRLRIRFTGPSRAYEDQTLHYQEECRA
jgi:hypothetical protein